VSRCSRTARVLSNIYLSVATYAGIQNGRQEAISCARKSRPVFTLRKVRVEVCEKVRVEVCQTRACSGMTTTIRE
jgi:hypothetical protein